MNLKQEYLQNEFFEHEMSLEHRAIEDEMSFYIAVSKGDKDYIEDALKKKSFFHPDKLEQLSDCPIQNTRYHFIVSTAMITRYCTYNGLEQERAYRMSDFYIRKMDRCQSIDEIMDLYDTMCLDYCGQMLFLQREQVFSKPVSLTLNYIYNHIHERITIKMLAEQVHLSESYLSKLFLKETQISISEYILNLKIDKAKNLLQYSDFSIIEISNYLSFASQSHFIAVFSKKVGTTPRKYRVKHYRSNWEDSFY